MATILHTLNAEWATLTKSPPARRALMRWKAKHDFLTGAMDLDDVLTLGRDGDVGPDLRRALAALAANDDVAARTLLQALLGGLCNLARRIGRDSDALDDIVSIAWERIRTYPTHRPGSVSGNVLLDVRKRYQRMHRPLGDSEALAAQVPEPSVEDRVLLSAFLEDLVKAGFNAGVSTRILETIVRSRVDGESMADLAAEQNVSLKVLWHRRWRAEARLRDFASAG